MKYPLSSLEEGLVPTATSSYFAVPVAQVAEAARQTGFLQALPSRAFSLGVSLQSCRSRASL